MQYSISRYEKYRTHEGTVSAIFLAVNCSNGTDGSYYEHWLTVEEKDLVLADEANLKPILERCYAECELKMENEIATRPMPTVYPLQEEVVEGEPSKKEVLEALVEVADVAAKKEAIVFEKAEVARIEAERLQAIADAKVIEESLEEPVIPE